MHQTRLSTHKKFWLPFVCVDCRDCRLFVLHRDIKTHFADSRCCFVFDLILNLNSTLFHHFSTSLNHFFWLYR